MIIIFITDGMYLSFCIFMFYPEPHMGISSVGSFQVQFGGSLIFYRSFRCRKIALKREDSLHLGVGIDAFGQVYGGLWAIGTSVVLAIHLSVHLCIYVYHYMHQSICLYIHG